METGWSLVLGSLFMMVTADARKLNDNSAAVEEVLMVRTL